MVVIKTLEQLAEQILALPSSGCLIINIAGGVAVGKTTFANKLARCFNQINITAVVCSTDNFLFSNSKLEAYNLTDKKGWPETYEWEAISNFIASCKLQRKSNYSVPYYCHQEYDVIANKYLHISQPDVLIIEGVVALNKQLIDYSDYSIYMDVHESYAKQWFSARCLAMIQASVGQPDNFYHRWSAWDPEQIVPVISQYWEQVNIKNLKQNIIQTKKNADLIISKDARHTLSFSEVKCD